MKVDKQTVTETINTTGKNLYNVVKKLVHEGNIRKITIKTKEGKVLIEFPLTLGVVGAALAPLFMMIATFAALISDFVIYIEKDTPIPPKTETESEILE